MAKKTKDPSEKLGFGNLLAWNSRMVSTSIMVLLMGFLMAYCTDTLGITPAYVSIILVASKLLDGVTDANGEKPAHMSYTLSFCGWLPG